MFGKLLNKGSILIMCIVSLVILTICIVSIVQPKKDYLETQGVIVDFKEFYDVTSDSNVTKTYIDYEVDGKTYKNVEYPSYNSGMKINDTVTVLYEPEDPTFIQAPGGEKVPYIVGGAAIVSLIVSVILLIRR